MTVQRTSSGERAVTVAGLVVGAAGIAILWASRVEFPVAIPPGLVILLVAAGLVAILPWRWTPVIGAVVGLFMFVGFFGSGAVGNLFDPARLGVFTGASVQFLAVIVAAVAGIAATIQNYRTRS